MPSIVSDDRSVPVEAYAGAWQFSCMALIFRPPTAEDVVPCGRIAYEAFCRISTAHNFPPDFPSPEIAIAVMSMLVEHPGYFVVVAERDGRVVGSNVLDERSQIAGVGPITVDPEEQNAGVGRDLMLQVIERARTRAFPGVRLVQAAFHCRSLSLYTKLGFDPREPLSCMQGAALKLEIPGYRVRPARSDDVTACDAVCQQVHGHTRAGELRDAIEQGAAQVVEHDGRLTGYATGIAFFSHAVGVSNNEIKALIGAAPGFAGPGFLVPTRNADLLRWCLDHGLRIVQPMTLMSRGLYNEPTGAFLPSIGF
jgi:GNAT superfamily N-acetyltransferase